MFIDIESDNDKVNFFTGLPDKETFYMLRDLLERFPLNYHSEWNVGSLQLAEQW